MGDYEYKIGDKIKIIDPIIINELRGDHKVLRLLKNSWEEQPFITGRGLNAGRMIPETPREDSDYIVDTIEGFIFEAGWACHPIGGADWERDKFQSLEVMLSFGAYAPLKGYWCEKVDDGELPDCSVCDKPTRNWIGDRWSCLSCVERGITTKVSKPCGPCGCPGWDHGGVSGCFGSSHQEERCDGCSGFIPNESADDIICSQERYDELLAIQEKLAESCKGFWKNE